MFEPDDVFFVNPFSRFIRVFLMLFVVLAAVGASSAVTVAQVGGRIGKPMNDLQLGWTMGAFMSSMLALAMLICVVSFLAPARRAERILAEFRNGRFLVKWIYPPEFWIACLEALPRLKRQTPAWARVALGIFFGALGLIVVAALGLLVAVAGPKTAAAAGIGWAIFALGVPPVALGFVIAFLIDLARKLQDMRRSSPWAFVAEQAVYCGGEFAYWGRGMLVLDNVRLLPGPPTVLELTTGMSRGVQRALTVAHGFSLLVGHPMASSDQRQQHFVPVPPDALAEAQMLLETLKCG